jgi:pyrroline-5-carboxylate reductase
MPDTKQGKSMKIAFIGGGNMATALIGGLYKSNPDVTVHVADPNPDVKTRLEGQFPVTCFAVAADAIAGMDMIVLAVKPQILPQVLEQIGRQVTAQQLVISIVAGITATQIANGIKAPAAIVRTMPNTPALLGLGITGLFADEYCSLQQKEQAKQLMSAAGETVWLQDESLIDVVTAVSGSGPAYFFYLIEAMRKAGARLGLPPDVAAKLALHTAYGASAMAIKSDVDVSELRQRVTSKGGTTQAAIECLQAGGFETLVDAAVSAATERGRELSTPTKPATGDQQ